ncbi:MAG: rod shape-determining protein MreD, partial [Candidatus Limnocylindrales bacterium]
LTELTVSGIKPDLVFVVAVVVAMVVSFEDALVWAVVGGLLVDAMSARPIGATTLALLLVIGLATLAGRITRNPRTVTVIAAVLALTWVFQVLLLAILAATGGIALVELPTGRILIIAIVNVALALLVLALQRALFARFRSPERIEW